MRRSSRRASWRFVCGLFALMAIAHSLVSAASSTQPPSIGSTIVPIPKTTRIPVIAPRNHTTWKPLRDNCTPPAIEQFPRPLMSPESRRSGGLIIHVLVAVYTFIGLAIVCDDYFVASLDRICEELKLSPDVAGATFMAAGSSAPELATVVIGVFFAKDDIGVSGVIGSAVFNIMFVISICALCTSTVVYLNWWPLVRDCFFYMISILVMLYTIYDELITWSESLLMLIMYGVYCITLHYNTTLEQWAQTLPVPCKRDTPVPQGPQPIVGEESGLMSYRSMEAQKQTTYTEERNQQQLVALSPEDKNTGGFGSPYTTETSLENGGNEPPPKPAALPNQGVVTAPTGQPEYYHKAPRPELEEIDPFVIPEGRLNRFTWAICVPIHVLCRATTPNCRKEKWRNYYPLTFFMAMIWISFYSYIMVWMITIIGSTLGIPDTVMGLTFVAAGVSVPDALSSLAVVKEGYGDMAVSNAVGSNVFDILICLGLPWFLQTAIIKPGSHVNVISKGLTYSTLSLLSTVAFLIVATHLNGWKLDRKYGWILMMWYIFFILFASLYELNVFGYMNPPECVSAY